jgi:hypothetical protein
VVGKLVRDGGDEFVVAGTPSDERHVGDPACLVEVRAAALLGCGLLTAALLSDVHHARDRCAREREAGSSCGFLGHRSACYQEPDRGDGEQQDRPIGREPHAISS